MGWSSADFEDVRTTQGNGGLVEIELIVGKPPVTVDLSGLMPLVFQGHLGNPFLAADPAPGTAEDPASPPQAVVQDDAFWARARKVTAWQDRLLAAIVVDPPWCPMAEIPRGARPAGQLCIYDLTTEERRRAVDLVFAGVDGLATFRADVARARAVSDGAGVSPAPEPVAPAADTAPRPLLARSSPVAHRAKSRAAG